MQSKFLSKQKVPHALRQENKARKPSSIVNTRVLLYCISTVYLYSQYCTNVYLVFQQATRDTKWKETNIKKRSVHE